MWKIAKEHPCNQQCTPEGMWSVSVPQGSASVSIVVYGGKATTDVHCAVPSSGAYLVAADKS